MARTMTSSDRGTPSKLDRAQLAQQSGAQLRRYLQHRPKQAVRVRLESQKEPLSIPPVALEKLEEVLHALGEGSEVVVVARSAELTTQQAANLLGVSRPFLIEQIEQGHLQCRKVGAHRRIRVVDLLRYQRRQESRRRRTLDALASLDQRLGLV